MLKNIITKPHLFFFGLVPIFLCIAFFKKENYLNLNIDYFNFDVSISLLSNTAAIFFLLIGINYFSISWAKKTPKKALTSIHIFLQILTLIPYTILLIAPNYALSYFIFILAFIIFLVSLLIHFINFFSSLLLKRT